MKRLRVVVAGSGTGVGKTTIAAELIRGLSPALRGVGLKPVESGCVDGEAPDAAELSRAAGKKFEPLYALSEPVSPHMAAEHEHMRVSISRILAWTNESEAQSGSEFSVIETAGGLCSPLSVTEGRLETNLDLLAHLKPELWVLVVADRLGALHDLEVARIAAAARFRLPDAIVLTEALQPRAETAALRNLNEARRWCSELVLHSGDGPGPLVELVREAFEAGASPL